MDDYPQLDVIAVGADRHDAVGDTIGSESVTDGLGLALTGAAWILLGYALTRQPISSR